MKKNYIAALLLILLPIISNAQNTTAFSVASFSPIAGSWQGSLCFLDYRDNLTKTAVTCSVTIRLSELQNFLLMNYVFEDSLSKTEKLFVFSFEPESGKLISRTAQNNEVKFWKIDQYQPNPFELVISAAGSDYGNPALIQQKFIAQNDTLVISRIVLYPKRKPIVRNEILLVRNSH